MVNLEYELIYGLAKGHDYETGGRPTSRHVWVAVLIDEVWRLIDIRWGASCVDDPNTRQWRLVENTGQKLVQPSPEQLEEQELEEVVLEGQIVTFYRCDDYYFITDPDQFISRHLPEDPKWQLLGRPINGVEFQQMADLWPQFFKFKMGVGSCEKAIIRSTDGLVELQLEIPEKCQIIFGYKLWVCTSGEYRSDLSNVDLDRYVFLEQGGGYVTTKCTLPVAGKYKLDIFGRYPEEKGEPETKLKRICTYVILCDIPMPDCEVVYILVYTFFFLYYMSQLVIENCS